MPVGDVHVEDHRVLFLSLVVTAISNDATLTVDVNGGGDYIDMESATDAATDGDTMLDYPT